MKLRYIDIHSHINIKDYDVDREEVITRAEENNVGFFVVGTDVESSRSAVSLCTNRKNMWSIVGIHPTEMKEDINAIRELADDSKVIAIGECGLDYFRVEETDRKKQIEVFEKQIYIANEVNKPLMLHVRNDRVGGVAYVEAVGILKRISKVRANFHFFAGGISDLKSILDIGSTVSFTGVVTFARDYDEVIRNVPKDSFMVETDSPFVSPVPFRGKRNEPVRVIEVVKTIAKIRGEDEEEMREQVMKNTKEFFGINLS